MLDNVHDLALCALAFCLAYIIPLILYRLYFHPLAHIPAPPLAKFTYLFEWYYDLALSGQLAFRLKTLHQKYGPVIRINPDTVHIADPEYFDELFNQTNGRNVKTTRIAEAFGPYPNVLGTASHEPHRLRRSALNSFFSKKAVNDLLPAMLRPINILCKRLEDASESNETLNMKYIFAAVTLDIINDYCFARESACTLQPDFGRKGFENIDNFLKLSLVNVHIPWLMRFTYALPDRINKILAPTLAETLDFRRTIRRGLDNAHKHADHRTVFHELLTSKLPPQELARDRLRDEAFGLVTAGSGTTAIVLRNTTYHIAANESIRQKLQTELCTAIPDASAPLSLAHLEQLPYLLAVVNEGLRLCAPVTHRLTRQFPDRTLTCNNYTIPAGCSVSVTLPLILENESIFPEPRAFRPDRWIGQEKHLEKYLIPFSRGPRACLGLNLARAEIVLILAAVFRDFTFDVSAVVRERDVDTTRDLILAQTAPDSPGLLVKVRKC
ncbi:hypothetical protein BDV06DRAFT_214721 [Aspergillus oleicola]